MKEDLSFIDQEFLTALDNHDHEQIKQAILNGANPNLTLWNNNTEKYISVYAYYSIAQQNISLLPFMIEHGLSVFDHQPYLLEQFAANNDLPSIELLYSLDVHLFDSIHWGSLAIKNQSSDVIPYFLKHLVTHLKKETGLSHLSTIPSLISAVIYSKDSTLFQHVTQLLSDHDLLSFIVNIYGYQTSDGDLSLLNYAEKLVRISDVENLDYLLNDPMFYWSISQKKLYAHLFSYAVHQWSFDVLHYIWDKGYDFDLSTSENPESKIVEFHHTVTLIPNNSIPISTYVENYMKTKRQRDFLQTELSQQNGGTTVKI